MWGTADYFAGRLSKKHHPFAVLGFSRRGRGAGVRIHGRDRRSRRATLRVVALGACVSSFLWPSMSVACAIGNATACPPPPGLLQSVEDITLFSVSAGTIAALLVLLALLYKWRNTRTMHSATPVFCAFIIFGSLLVVLSDLVQSLPPTPATCAATTALLHIGFTTAYGALFIKTYRLASIFSVRARFFRFLDV